MNISAEIAAMKNPVDPDLFLKMTQVFHDAARNPLPRPRKRRPGLYLTDIPMNRGMLGVIKALREAKVPDGSFSAFSNRIMLMGSIFKHAEHFPGLIKPSADGAIDVADALLKAAAIATIIGDDRAAFDLDDVLAKAREFEAGTAAHAGAKAE